MHSGHRRSRPSLAAGLAVLLFVAGGVSIGVAGAVPSTDPSVPQEPFLCTTEFNMLGQPIVDNQDMEGTPVYPEDAGGNPDRTQEPIGWSKNCQADTVVEYGYRDTSGAVKSLPIGTTTLPADIAMIPVSELRGTDQMDLGGVTEIPFIYRYERGTLPQNRFVYSIAMLAPFSEVSDPASGASTDLWNGRLLFFFGGGVAIGHSQGGLSGTDSQSYEALRLGHAVVYSSGTRMNVHYNLMLAARTAVELKGLFVEEYGDPVYTVGIGASGGSIQQFHLAQNDPDVLDALIPMYSYPDMTTQTIHVGDCEMLEYYMDVTDGSNPRWADWDDRQIIQGMHTIEGFTSSWQARAGNSGSSECIEGWRGLTPLVLNPTFPAPDKLGDVIGPFVDEITDKAIAKLMDPNAPAVYPDDFPDLGRVLRTYEDPSQWVEWTHWEDTAEVYGVGDDGFARVPWDNVGVQYGLRAVAQGQITPAEFLKLNAEIGSWTDTADMVPEDCDMIGALAGSDFALLGSIVGLCSGNDADWYSSGNMRLGLDANGVAPRHEGDIVAMQNAYSSGLVFSGNTARDIPILETRPYLEDELNMHNSQQSFVIRDRIRAAQGDDANHVIWFQDARPSMSDAAESDYVSRMLVTMDDWMANVMANPSSSAADNRPNAAVDSCFATDGSLIAAGNGVWDGAEQMILTGAGAWKGTAPDTVTDPDTGSEITLGECTKVFPLYSTSRVVAGGPLAENIYKCQLKPVARAIADGDYGDWEPSASEVTRLEEIFADGVCDYSVMGVGMPGWVPPEPDPEPVPPVIPPVVDIEPVAPPGDEVPAPVEPTDTGTVVDLGGTSAPLPAAQGPSRALRSGELPRTGSRSGDLVALGVALIVAGAGVELARRRRLRSV